MAMRDEGSGATRSLAFARCTCYVAPGSGPIVMTLRLDGDSVSQFYDDNTGLFLSLGQGTEGSIHRAVWGPGVSTRPEAMAYVDGLVLQRLQRLAAARGDARPRVAAVLAVWS